MTPHAPGLGRRFAILGAATLTLVSLGAASVAVTSATSATSDSKSKAPVAKWDASKSKKTDVTVEQASKSKKTNVVIIPVSKSKKAEKAATGDVVIPAAYARGPVAYARGPVTAVNAAYARGPVTAVPAAYGKGRMAAPAALAAVAYTSCGLTTTNGYGSVRVSLTVTGTTLVDITETITNYQDRAFTPDVIRIWDEFGVRKGPGGWLAPGQSKSWKVYNVDGAAGRYYVKGHATTNPGLVDSCGGFVR